MMDIEKLIEQLSIRGLGNGTSLGYHSGLFDEAATALSALQAENEKLRAELEQVKRERDAAVDCCSGYCASCLFVKDCAKHDMNDAAPTRWYYGDCEDWEWRGRKED